MNLFCFGDGGAAERHGASEPVHLQPKQGAGSLHPAPLELHGHRLAGEAGPEAAVKVSLRPGLDRLDITCLEGTGLISLNILLILTIQVGSQHLSDARPLGI